MDYKTTNVGNAVITSASGEIPPVEPSLTLEEQIAQLKEDNLILMDALATIYEDMLAKGTV